MAIKKMNADMLDKIISNAQSETKEEHKEAISQERLEELYEIGEAEISEILMTIGLSVAVLKSSAFAPVLMNSDVVHDYIKYMAFFCEDMLPKLLKGDIDGIMDLTVEDAIITKERLLELREMVYNLLEEKANQK